MMLAPGPPTVVTLTIEPQGREFYLIVWPIDDGQTEAVETVMAEILPSPTSSYTPDNSTQFRTINIQDP